MQKRQSDNKFACTRAFSIWGCRLTCVDCCLPRASSAAQRCKHDHTIIMNRRMMLRLAPYNTLPQCTQLVCILPHCVPFTNNVLRLDTASWLCQRLRIAASVSRAIALICRPRRGRLIGLCSSRTPNRVLSMHVCDAPANQVMQQ